MCVYTAIVCGCGGVVSGWVCGFVSGWVCRLCGCMCGCGCVGG